MEEAQHHGRGLAICGQCREPGGQIGGEGCEQNRSVRSFTRSVARGKEVIEGLVGENRNDLLLCEVERGRERRETGYRFRGASVSRRTHKKRIRSLAQGCEVLRHRVHHLDFGEELATELARKGERYRVFSDTRSNSQVSAL